MDIYNKFKECGSVATDSRTLKLGGMYFALSGTGADARDALEALEAGAAYAVVDAASEVGAACAAGSLPADVASRLVLVENAFRTLQELARWHRSMTFVDGRPIAVIAVAGADGAEYRKAVADVLSSKMNVVASEDGMDDAVGVSKTLLRIDGTTKVVVVGMRADRRGGIKELVDIALPNYGLVTGIDGSAFSGGEEEAVGVYGELYDYLRRTSDKVFLNVDDMRLCRMASERGLHHDPERAGSLVIPYGGGESLPACEAAAQAVGEYLA